MAGERQKDVVEVRGANREPVDVDRRVLELVEQRAQRAHAAIRSVVATMTHDRTLAPDFVRAAELIASGKVAEALE